MPDTLNYTSALAERNGNDPAIAGFDDPTASLPAVPDRPQRPTEPLADPYDVASACELLPKHRDDLRRSGLTDETICAAGLYSETNHERLDEMLHFNWQQRNGAALVFPFFDLHGKQVLCRVKPDNPPLKEGKPAKYLSPRKSGVRVYIPPAARNALQEPTQPLFITEGEKKALCATQHGFMCLGLTGVDCWHPRRSSALLSDLKQIALNGRTIYIVFDSDAAKNADVQQNESLLAVALEHQGAIVKVVRLPQHPGDPKVGFDDFLVAQGPEKFRHLLSRAVGALPPDPAQLWIAGSQIDAASEAKRFLETTVDWSTGSPTLRRWRGQFYHYCDGCYAEVGDDDVRVKLMDFLNSHVRPMYKSHVDNVLDQLKTQSHLDSAIEQPAWINGKTWSSPTDILVCRNALVDLPAFMAARETSRCTELSRWMRDVTPDFFTTTTLGYYFLPDAPSPKKWLDFLQQLWEGDTESIETLQEWFGYVLTPDTRLQKILTLVGPKRSGKGTIVRVLTEMLGRHNVVSPQLASLGTQFGLALLLGKMLAVIPDARLDGNVNSALITERMLSISGEDAVTIDRKYREPATQKLPTRLMLVSNELPWLNDVSGALASRMILLRLRETFFGREDTELTAKLLEELPGILLWAIEGRQRLNARKEFLQPDSSRDLWNDLNELSSPMLQFVNDRCKLERNAFISTHALFEAWKYWCAENGKKSEGTTARFGRDLLAACPTLSTRRPRDGETRVRGYDGIRLISGSGSFGPGRSGTGPGENST